MTLPVASSFLDVSLADVVLGGLGVLVSFFGVRQMMRQNRLIGQSNDHANEAVQKSKEANEIASSALREATRSNEIAAEALELERNRTLVKLKINARVAREQTLNSDGTIQSESKKLEVTVVNEGRDAAIAGASLTRPGWEVGAGVEVWPWRFPLELKSMSAIKGSISDRSSRFSDHASACALCEYLRVVAATGEEFVCADSAVTEFLEHMRGLAKGRRLA